MLQRYNKMKDQVIPKLSHIPIRTYIHDGNGLITCYNINNFRYGIDPKIETGEIIFVLSLTIKQAQMLMEDLYYGEYTGA